MLGSGPLCTSDVTRYAEPLGSWHIGKAGMTSPWICICIPLHCSKMIDAIPGAVNTPPKLWRHVPILWHLVAPKRQSWGPKPLLWAVAMDVNITFVQLFHFLLLETEVVWVFCWIIPYWNCWRILILRGMFVCLQITLTGRCTAYTEKLPGRNVKVHDNSP